MSKYSIENIKIFKDTCFIHHKKQTKKTLKPAVLYILTHTQEAETLDTSSTITLKIVRILKLRAKFIILIVMQSIHIQQYQQSCHTSFNSSWITHWRWNWCHFVFASLPTSVCAWRTATARHSSLSYQHYVLMTESIQREM